MRLSIALLLVLAYPLCFFADAQEDAPAVAPSSVDVSAELTSPKATLSKFLESMNAVQAGRAEQWSTVLECIYFKDLSAEERVIRGRELATRLYEVLNAVTLDLEKIAEPGDSRELTLVLGAQGEVSLDFRLNDDGAWRFSRSKLEANLSELAEVVEEAAEKTTADVRVNPLLSSPRQTMKTFLTGMNRWDDGGRQEALLTLDLSQMAEAVREEKGEELAVRIKNILDRDRLVIYQEIHDDPNGAPYVHLVDSSDPTQRLLIEIVPLPIDDSATASEWRFSAATLEAVPALWDLYKDLPVVRGIDDDVPQVFSLQLRDWIDSHFPFLMSRSILLENWQWLGLFIIIILGLVVSRLAAFVLLRIVRASFRRQNFQLENKLERDFVRPIRIAIMAWVWWLALRPLGLPASSLIFIKQAAATLSAIALVWAVYRLVDIFGSYLSEKAKQTENKFDDLVAPLVARSLKILTIVFGMVFVAELSGRDYKTALAGVGIGGLAFALAAKDTLGNIFGSLTVLFDKPFQIGDWVQIGDVDGNVESVGIRSTRIRTFYNSVVTVPNSTLTNAVVDNYGARKYRRIRMMIGIKYDTSPEQVDAFCEGIRELIRLHPYTRTDYYHVYLNEFAPSSLNILLYCFHECPDWSTELRERHRLLLDIVRLAKNLNVDFAYPTQTLHIQGDGAQVSPGAFSKNGDDALVLGRNEAAAIVNQGFGSGEMPAPVAFEPPRKKWTDPS